MTGSVLRLRFLKWLPRIVVFGTVGAGTCDDCFASGHGSAAAELHGGHSGHSDPGSSSSAIDLGEYRIRSYYPVQAQKSIVRFVVYATAPPERLAEGKQLVAHRRHKIRDQIITATRMMPLAEFDDPELKRFRRRIVLRLRRAEPDLPIEELYISNFELQVQSL
jgi:hypothetical protein